MEGLKWLFFKAVLKIDAEFANLSRMCKSNFNKSRTILLLTAIMNFLSISQSESIQSAGQFSITKLENKNIKCPDWTRYGLFKLLAIIISPILKYWGKLLRAKVWGQMNSGRILQVNW